MQTWATNSTHNNDQPLARPSRHGLLVRFELQYGKEILRALELVQLEQRTPAAQGVEARLELWLAAQNEVCLLHLPGARKVRLQKQQQEEEKEKKKIQTQCVHKILATRTCKYSKPSSMAATRCAVL